MVIRLAIVGCSALLAAACSTFPPDRSDVVRASDVIDSLKTQLAGVSAKQVTGKGGVCGGGNGQVAIVAVPTSATVSLKAVTTLSKSGSVGGTFPALSIPVGPSFSYTSTRATTQVVTFELNIAHDSKTEADLATEIKMLRTQSEADAATLKDLDDRLSADQKAFLTDQMRMNAATVSEDEKQLLEAHMSKSYIVPTLLDEDISKVHGLSAPVTLVGHVEELKKDMTIAEAISAAEVELLKVNHDLKPCLKPQTIKVELDFDLQRKKDKSLAITVVIWKFGTERVSTNEQFHSMVVTFDLTQGSPLLYTN